MSQSPSSANNALNTPEEQHPATEETDLFSILSEAASRVLQRRFRVLLLIRQAYDRMLSHSNVFAAVWKDLQTMLRLLLRWVDQSYRHVSWTPLVLIVGAVIYLVTPVDLLPDTLGALGFMDDATVISTVVRRIRDELNQFRAWERETLLPE